MSLNGAAILVDGTVSSTGGTSTTLGTKGNTLNQHNLILQDGSESIDQTRLQVTVTDGKVQSTAPGGYTQDRVKTKWIIPRTLASGEVSHDTIVVEQNTGVETTAAQKLSMRVLAGENLHDSDFTELWNNRNLS